MELYIVRHGETVWNKQWRLQGSTDIKLSENGIDMAKKTGYGMKNIDFKVAYSSPLSRAYDTAKIIVGNRNGPGRVNIFLTDRKYLRLIKTEKA